MGRFCPSRAPQAFHSIQCTSNERAHQAVWAQACTQGFQCRLDVVGPSLQPPPPPPGQQFGSHNDVLSTAVPQQGSFSTSRSAGFNQTARIMRPRGTRQR